MEMPDARCQMEMPDARCQMPDATASTTPRSSQVRSSKCVRHWALGAVSRAAHRVECRVPSAECRRSFIYINGKWQMADTASILDTQYWILAVFAFVFVLFALCLRTAGRRRCSPLVPHPCPRFCFCPAPGSRMYDMHDDTVCTCLATYATRHARYPAKYQIPHTS
jgi:hypothetical protein